ncbi:MAG: type IV pilus modification PilV family protein [Hyphomicrobiaceae bacterium]
MKSVSIGSLVGLSQNNSSDPDAAASRGFTLLEALVGLTIFAVAMSALFAAYANAVRVSHHAETHTQAQILAQSLLAEATAMRDRVPVSRRGRTRNLAWTLVVRPAAGPLAVRNAAHSGGLYHITVHVRRSGRSAIKLETLLWVGEKS